MKNFSFLLRTAYRDSRKNRFRLFMFMSSIVLGITALVAINSFNDNLIKDIDRQAATLLGADLVTSGNRPIGPISKASLDSLPGQQSTEAEILSMAYIMKNDESQFVRIKGVEGDFPYYGKLKTEPLAAAQNYKQDGSILVDNSIMLQQNLQVGDSLKLGDSKHIIGGRLKSAFGGSGITSSFAPIIYMSYADLQKTNLLRAGSLVNYSYFQKLPDGFDIEPWRKNRRKQFRNESMRMETVEGRKENLNEAFDSLNYFLNLVALVSLLLGCIGVASSVFIYVKTKISSIAIFRCLGMNGKDAFMIYFLQISGLGILSVLVGTVLGSAIQLLIPRILKDLLPIEVTTTLSWPAIAEGFIIGSTITMLFALMPLISVRKISPLRTLRASFDGDIKKRDPLQWLIYFGIFISIFLFLRRLTGAWDSAAIFSGGLLISFLILFFVSKLIIWAVKKFFPRNWSFVLRQGLSNLFRPDNQTQTLLVSIGLGTAVLTTLFIVQGLLLNNVANMDAGNQPNMILYGIENNQDSSLQKITESYDMPVIQSVPIVTMKLDEWKGRTRAEWLADTSRTTRNWAVNREARVTYRDHLDEFEELVEGDFTGEYKAGDDSIFVSLDKGYAEGIDVNLGDELVWNVQGTRITTYVNSFRKIDFTKMQARFFVVFPTGVLESAPQFRVLVSKSPSTAVTAKYRAEVVRTFPNVSVVDLGMILESLNDILNKVSYIIQFMALFSILTGLIVLISSLLLSKYQRIKESVLLRTLGASKKQILQINATEYIILGALSAATGIFISIVGSYLLATYQLELKFELNWIPVILIFVFVVSLTLIIGLLNSREVLVKSPLEVLRSEAG